MINIHTWPAFNQTVIILKVEDRKKKLGWYNYAKISILIHFECDMFENKMAFGNFHEFNLFYILWFLNTMGLGKCLDLVI